MKFAWKTPSGCDVYWGAGRRRTLRNPSLEKKGFCGVGFMHISRQKSPAERLRDEINILCNLEPPAGARLVGPIPRAADGRRMPWCRFPHGLLSSARAAEDRLQLPEQAISIGARYLVIARRKRRGGEGHPEANHRQEIKNDGPDAAGWRKRPTDPILGFGRKNRFKSDRATGCMQVVIGRNGKAKTEERIRNAGYTSCAKVDLEGDFINVRERGSGPALYCFITRSSMLWAAQDYKGMFLGRPASASIIRT